MIARLKQPRENFLPPPGFETWHSALQRAIPRGQFQICLHKQRFICDTLKSFAYFIKNVYLEDTFF